VEALEDRTVLSPPSGLGVEVNGGLVTVHWDAVAGASSYNVYRGTSPGGEGSTPLVSGLTGTSYIDPAVTMGLTYYYEVAGVTASGVGALSGELPATLQLPPGIKLNGSIIGTPGSDTGNTIVNAFDGNLSSFFDAPAPGNGDWVGLDLGAPAVINQVRFAPRPGWPARMVGGVFQGSNTADFSSGVVNLFTITAAPPVGLFTGQAITNTGAFRYVRYLAPDGTYGDVAELEFDGVPQPPPPPPPAGFKLTGKTIGTPGSLNGAGNTIDNAFDNNFGTFFDAPAPGNGDWVGLDLGAPAQITQVDYAPRASWEQRMVGGIFQASNTADFSSGVANLFTITSPPTAGLFTAQAITNPGSYRYVRYLAPDGSYGNIAELEFDGVQSPIGNSGSDIQAVSLVDPTLAGISGAGASSSTNFSISSDGRLRVFSSYASNLVTGDTNNAEDVFLQDQTTGAVTLLSRGPGGAANGDSDQAVISADGRYVAFTSKASNLVPGDLNGKSDVFIEDLQTGTVLLVSTGANGQGNDDSFNPVLSADGRYVAFTSAASNLDPNKTDHAFDVFRKDMQTGEVRLVSTGPGGQGSASGDGASISGDGRLVSFVSFANNLVPGDTNGAYDAFVKDMDTGVVTLVNQGAQGPGNRGSTNAFLSADGRYVAFSSQATNLVLGDTNGVGDAFVKDLQTGAVSLVSASTAGPGNGQSVAGPISADGRFVLVKSFATNLVSQAVGPGFQIFLKDTLTGSIQLVTTGAAGPANSDGQFPALSGDGRYVQFMSGASNLVPNDNNGAADVFVRDTQAATTTLISNRNASLAPATAGGSLPQVSADGRFVVFSSASDLIVPGDTNNCSDVFVKDLSTGTIQLVSQGAQGIGNGASFGGFISPDDRYIVFTTLANNLVAGDTNGYADVLMKDLQTGIITLVSAGASGIGNGSSLAGSFSGNGRYLLFRSLATNLLPGIQSGVRQLFVKDLQTGGLTLASASASNIAADSEPTDGAISTDGRFVAFSSRADNLVPGDNNQASDIFVKDMLTGQIVQVPTGLVGPVGQFASGPALSADGRYVAFFTSVSNNQATVSTVQVKDLQTGTIRKLNLGPVSGQPALSADGRLLFFAGDASNLVPDDNNQASDIFVMDLSSGVTQLLSRGASGPGNGASASPAISSDGSVVAFESLATNFVDRDFNGSNDVFVTTVHPSQPPTVVAIDAGGIAAGAFQADTGFSGGSTYHTTATIDTSAASNPAPQTVYQSERYGNFSYKATGLTPGTSYTVRLHFAELYFTSAGQRIFNVTINGSPVLTNFDVFAQAGAQNKAIALTFAATADRTGAIAINFTSVKNNAKVSGIEILRSGTGPVVPAPVTGLTATAGNAQVALNWSPSVSATSYNVYRGASSGGEAATPVKTGVTGTAFTDTGVSNGITYYYQVTAANTAGESGRSAEASATPQPPSSVVWAVDAGGAAAGAFQSDTGFTGGATYQTTAAIDTSAVSSPAPQAVYQSERYGNFSYKATGFTAGASYTVRLHFAEVYFTSAGQRVFNVTINGNQVLTNFDIFADAGAKNKATVKTFTTTVDATGAITISFTSVKNNAKVSGIEILTNGGTTTVPSPPAGLNATAGNGQVTLSWTASPGAISYNLYRGTTAGGEAAIPVQTGITSTSFTDLGLTNGTKYYYQVSAVNAAGESRSAEVSTTPQPPSQTVVWAVAAGGAATGSFQADTGFTGGATYHMTAAIDTTGVTNAAPPAVYQNERYGNFSYKATGLTPGASYTVRLHFAEIYFTSAGQRIFNVTINGVQVLTNFDIFALTSAKNKALVETFTAIADATGAITIGFTSVKNNAKVSGIEIIG
jgi:fibronectin type 3 domain-containing protein